jgi:predicted acylesterase/phospholipase RssA
MDGPLADTAPWQDDPHVRAELVRIEELHVRASGAIPFLFPPVQIGDLFYVDGALRLATPVSPAVRPTTRFSTCSARLARPPRDEGGDAMSRHRATSVALAAALLLVLASCGLGGKPEQPPAPPPPQPQSLP